MKWCVSAVTFSMLINGTAVGYFECSRGLRQGDPLSLYLFIIVMETLSCPLRRAEDHKEVEHWQW